jgi:hypothetical protein
VRKAWIEISVENQSIFMKNRKTGGDRFPENRPVKFEIKKKQKPENPSDKPEKMSDKSEKPTDLSFFI